jgi:hypothetical protein
MHAMTRQTTTRCLLLAAAALLVGCAEAGHITAGGASLPPEEGSPAFLDRISSADRVTENDAMRGMLLLLDGQDPRGGFAERVEALRRRGIVNPDWDFRADRPLTRGKLAYMLYQALDVPGGIVLMISGPSQRYCLRELQYREFLGSGAVYGPVSGMEFVAALGRADAYRRTGEIPDELKPLKL